MSDASDDPREKMADDRTDLAEDRTLLANERTFSGWVRTAFATIGIGIGFNVLFRTIEPSWVPKAVATLFIALGIMVIVMAERRAAAVCRRLTAHRVDAAAPTNLRVIAIVFTIGALALIAVIWLFVWPESTQGTAQAV